MPWVVALVALVVDFDKHISPAMVEEPVRGIFGGPHHGGLVAQPLVLAEVEIADDDDHAEFVCAVEDMLQPRGVVWTQRAVCGECRVAPRLFLRVAIGDPP